VQVDLRVRRHLAGALEQRGEQAQCGQAERQGAARRGAEPGPGGHEERRLARRSTSFAGTIGPSRTARPARAALALLALAALAFLAVGLRSAIPLAEGRELTAAGIDDTTYERALDLFREAQEMEPGTEAELAEGSLLVVGDSREQAIRTIERAAREEPENARAWAVLAAAAGRAEPELAREAAARARELRPPVAP